MAAEQYFLKWNNHQTTLLSVFNSLLDSENLADCILCAEGESLKAHQVVLSACSPYLEKMLNENRANQFGGHPILIFNDLKFEELKAMREYMYKGEVNVAQHNLNSFLKAAQSLQVKGLADQGGGGEVDDTGGGGKRKSEAEYGGSRRRRQRRNSREENCDSESSSCDTSNVVKNQRQQRFNQDKYEEKYEPQVKMEPPDSGQNANQSMTPLKTEPEQHEVEPVQDLTLDDDDYEEYDVNMPGTSQADLSQEMTNWQMDGSMNSEDFAAAQAASLGNQNQTNAQGYSNSHNFLPSSGDLYNESETDPKFKLKYQCSDCDFVTQYKGNLTQHYKYKHHPNPKQYQCPACSYRSFAWSRIKRHAIQVHKTLDVLYESCKDSTV